MSNKLRTLKEVQHRLQLHQNHQSNLEFQLLDLKYTPNHSNIKELKYEIQTKIQLNLIHINELKWVLNLD